MRKSLSGNQHLSAVPQAQDGAASPVHYLRCAYSYNKNLLEENKVFFPFQGELKALELGRFATPVPSCASAARHKKEQCLGGCEN